MADLLPLFELIMFGINTVKQISETLLTSYTAWDEYVAVIWASLFSQYQFPLDGTIVEIAPGASSKIALALKRINFSGTIYIIEPYQQALELVSNKYSELLPKATIHPLNCLLIDCIQHLPTFIDCVVSHHALDDMIMAMDGGPEIFEQLFSWVTQDKLEVHPNFASRWHELSNQPQKLSHFEHQVIKQWITLIKKIKIRWLMMSQYPSLVLETETMRSLNQCAQNLLQKIKYQLQPQTISNFEIQEQLNQNLNYNFDLIGNEVLNAKNWLIYGDASSRTSQNIRHPERSEGSPVCSTSINDNDAQIIRRSFVVNSSG